jgi:hypothetical protein
MKTIFLSAPYSGDVEVNVKLAKHAARSLRDRGYNVFCPHVAIAGYCDDWNDNNKEHRGRILEMCAQWIKICDYFAQVPGWDRSDGCCFEYAVATISNKDIINLTFAQINSMV